MTAEVFNTWRDQPVEEILYQCRELLEDMDYPTVQRWRENGGKVIGHFQVYFPEEIAHAAGDHTTGNRMKEDRTWEGEIIIKTSIVDDVAKHERIAKEKRHQTE